MKILFLDLDPKMCAYAHCDEDVQGEHDGKIATYTRLLTSAHYYLSEGEAEILQSLDSSVWESALGSYKYDSQYWVEQKKENYQWLHDVWFWLNKEHWYRFDLQHDDWTNYYNKLSHIPENIPEGYFTPPPGEFTYFQHKYDEDSNLIPTPRSSDPTFQGELNGERKVYTKQCKENNATWGGSNSENMRQPPSWFLEDANV